MIFSKKFFFIILLAVALISFSHFTLAATDTYRPPTSNPPVCPDDNPGCTPPVDTSITAQIKDGHLQVGGLTSILGIRVTGGGAYSLLNGLLLGVNGNVGAKAYCDESGGNCHTSSEMFDGTNPNPNPNPNPNFNIADYVDSQPGCGDATGGKVWWNGSKFVCGVDRGGNGGAGTVTSITAGDGLKVVGSAGLEGGSISTAGTIKLRDCPADNILMTNVNGDWGCGSKSAGATYTADNSSLQLSAANQFSIKTEGVTTSKIKGYPDDPNSSNDYKVLVSDNGTVIWGTLPTIPAPALSCRYDQVKTISAIGGAVASGNMGCPVGYIVTGGGVGITSGTVGYIESYPGPLNTWHGRIQGTNPSGTVYAVCCKLQ